MITAQPSWITCILTKALAPSSPAVAAGVAKFVEDLLPRSGQKRSRVRSLGQNDLALAITLRVANLRILLGADLEEDGRAGMGWREVVSRFGSVDKDHQGSAFGPGASFRMCFSVA